MSNLTIQQVVDRCKCGVYLHFNEHRDNYDSAAAYLHDEADREDEPIAENWIIEKMIELNTIITIQFYPRTPITSYTVYHYDLQMALAEAIKTLDEIER